ncbi:MAG: YceI family protein [Pseudomonadota bacterium]
MPIRLNLFSLSLACLLLLASCSAPPTIPTVAPALEATATFPEDYYRQAQTQGRKVLQIDTTDSIVVIEVHRGGRLAHLGHNHVVAAHDIRGFIDPEAGRADLIIQLDQLVVDEPALRAEAGFDTQPSLDAIEGTRQNMLNKVLEAARFPTVLIGITRADPVQPNLQVAINLHGVKRIFEVPAQIENNAGRMVITGRLSFNQTDFGIVPFSVLGGAMRVEDGLDLRFRLVAR